MIKKVFAVSIIAATVALAGCSSDDDDDGGDPPAGGDMMPNPGNGNNLVDALTNDMGETAEDGTVSSRFDTLLSAAVATSVSDSLGDVNNNFILFAPVDTAFVGLDVPTLLMDLPNLGNTLSYHAVPLDAAPGTDFTLEAGTLTALAGGDLTIAAVEDDDEEEGGEDTPAEGEDTPAEGEEMEEMEADDDGFTVNGNEVGEPIFAENGVIYPIQVVLEPMTMAPDNGMGGGETTPPDGNLGTIETAFSTAADVSVAFEAYNAAGFGGSLDGSGGEPPAPNTWTLFAPSNAALTAASVGVADITDGVLQRHINTTASIGADALAGMTTIMNNVGGSYDVAVDGDGNTTVNGFVVTEIASGQSTVYQIEGVLP